jgi:tetratricopeptide (TPR) repeat protein
MDEASAELIARVARGIRERRWLIVVARRAYEGGFAVPEGVAPVEVELGPLPVEAAVTLVEQLTDDAPLPGHVTDTIAARSAGSPLFVTEMVAALRRGADLDALPQSVEAMMAVQIDDLASADRAVLRQASVLGARFDRASFVQALDLEEAEAEAALARLDRFLVADGEGGIRFRHGLLRDAAYHGLSFRRRRELHRRVGEALERGAGTDVTAVADQLTRHFFEAGVWEKALRYGLVAGREARAVFANQDAAALLERALAAGARLRGTRPELVTRIAESLGDVRLVLGETDAAVEAFRLARRRVHGDPVEEARLIEREATVLARSGENKKVRRLLSQGTRRLEGVHSLRAAATRAAIDAQRAVVEQRLGRPRAAIELAHRAIEEAETADAREPLAQALALLDFSYTTIGQRDRAVHSRRALELYEGLGQVGRRASLLLNLGVLAYYAGNWGEAVELYGQARDAFEAAGDRWYAAAGTFNIGEVLVAQGRLDEAEPVLRQALREGLVVGGGSRVAEVDSELGRLLGRRGDLDGAVFHLERAREAFIADGEELGVLDVDARLAEAHLLAGNADESLTRARSVLDAVGDDEEASLLVPGLRRVEGVALARSGDLAGAVVALEASLGASDELGSSYEAALALDALLEAGAEDAERRVRRDGLFEQLGIVAAPGRSA